MISSNNRIPIWAYGLFLVVVTTSVLYIITRNNKPIDGTGGTGSGNGNIYLVNNVWVGTAADKAGIKPGDKIYSINSFSILKGYSSILKNIPVGKTVQYEIDRNGKRFSIPVTIQSYWSKDSNFYWILYSSIFCLCIIGLYVLYKKPEEKSTKVFFIYIMLLALTFNSRWIGHTEIYSEVASAIFGFGLSVMGVSLMHFHLLFPQPSKLKINNTKFLTVLYITGFSIAFVYNYFHLKNVLNTTVENSVLFFTSAKYGLLWLGITLLAAFLIAYHQFRTTKEIIARNQLRWVIFGSVIGLSVILVCMFFPEIFWRLEYQFADNFFDKANGITSSIMIFCLLFAIFRYRLYDIEIIIKKTLLYFSVTIAAVLVYFIAVYLIQELVETESNITRTMSVVISAGVFLSAKGIFQNRIDKLFHHEKYDPARVVAEFEEDLSGIYEADILYNKIVEEINKVFKFKSFSFFICKFPGNYELVSSIEDKNTNDVINISKEFEKYLAGNRVFAVSELNEPPLFLTNNNAEIIVPLSDKNNIKGFFVCGQKISEFPYSMLDLQVLGNLARRTVSILYTAELYRKELEKQLTIERERARISRDMHDDIGSNLTRISILSEQVKRRIATSKEVNEQLEEISQSSREVISNISEIIWAVNPANDSLDNLVSYLNHYASRFLEGSNIKYTFIEPGQIPSIKLSAEQRRNIFLTIKEALNNAVKYSCAEEISLSVCSDNGGFSVIIKDNGKGFDEQNVKRGNGLLNMKKRIEEMNGSFSIITSLQGTEIIIKL